jgi:hypothetical protein
VFLPRNIPHGFRSIGGPAATLLIATPGGLDEYFADLHAAINANADPAEVRRSRRRTASSRPDRQRGAPASVTPLHWMP